MIQYKVMLSTKMKASFIGSPPHFFKPTNRFVILTHRSCLSKIKVLPSAKYVDEIC